MTWFSGVNDVVEIVDQQGTTGNKHVKLRVKMGFKIPTQYALNVVYKLIITNMAKTKKM